MKTFSIDYSKLPTQWSHIIIDGDQGSGKTTLAKEIAQVSGASIISLDDYLLENGAVYWEQIKYDSLHSAILASGPKVIIEGVCALKILEHIKVSRDYHIFIKLINGFAGWEYSYYLNEKAKPPKSKLMQDIVEYYKEFKPFEVCDLFLSRDLVG
jgi:hypothetical protein